MELVKAKRTKEEIKKECAELMMELGANVYQHEILIQRLGQVNKEGFDLEQSENGETPNDAA